MSFVATSEIDPLAIKAYFNIHCNNYKISSDIPLEEKKLHLINLNIYNSQNIHSIKDSEIHKVYNACIGSKNLGDISKLNINDVPDHDLLTYSFPCQDISSIGKLKGFDENSGTRSSLLWDCGKIIKNKKPKFLLMENVKNIVKYFMMLFYHTTAIFSRYNHSLFCIKKLILYKYY